MGSMNPLHVGGDHREDHHSPEQMLELIYGIVSKIDRRVYSIEEQIQAAMHRSYDDGCFALPGSSPQSVVNLQDPTGRRMSNKSAFGGSPIGVQLLPPTQQDARRGSAK